MFKYITLEGLKLAAAIGTPRTVKVINQSPPRRMKNDPGLRSAHEYKVSSFKDEYSFTCKAPDFIRITSWNYGHSYLCINMILYINIFWTYIPHIYVYFISMELNITPINYAFTPKVCMILINRTHTPLTFEYRVLLFRFFRYQRVALAVWNPRETFYLSNNVDFRLPRQT